MRARERQARGERLKSQLRVDGESETTVSTSLLIISKCEQHDKDDQYCNICLVTSMSVEAVDALGASAYGRAARVQCSGMGEGAVRKVKVC